MAAPATSASAACDSATSASALADVSGALRRAGAVLAQRARWLNLALAVAVCAEFLLMSQDPFVMSSHFDELLCKALFMGFYVSILWFITSFDSLAAFDSYDALT